MIDQDRNAGSQRSGRPNRQETDTTSTSDTTMYGKAQSLTQFEIGREESDRQIFCAYVVPPIWTPPGCCCVGRRLHRLLQRRPEHSEIIRSSELALSGGHVVPAANVHMES